MLNNRRIGAYVGVDPTAPSLHVGNLVPFMALGWLFIHGYSVTFLVDVNHCCSFHPLADINSWEGVQQPLVIRLTDCLLGKDRGALQERQP